jgi:hypothetical protein
MMRERVLVKREINQATRAQQCRNIISAQQRQLHDQRKISVHFKHTAADAQVMATEYAQRARSNQVEEDGRDRGFYDVNNEHVAVVYASF